MADYTIHLRHHRTDDILDVVSLFTAAQYRRVRNDLGSFSITLPWTDENLFVRWRLGNLVDFYRHTVRNDGKIIQKWVFGGIITERKFGVTDEGEFLEVTGVSYLRWLNGRVIFPFVDRTNLDPATGNPVRHLYHQVPFDQYYLYRDDTDPSKISADYKVTPAISIQPPLKALPSWFPNQYRPDDQGNYTPLPDIPPPPATDQYFEYRDPNDSHKLHPDYLPRAAVPEKPPQKQLPPGIAEPLPPVPILPLDTVLRTFVQKHVIEGIGYEWKTQVEEPTDRPRPLIKTTAHTGRTDPVSGKSYPHTQKELNWSGRFDQLLPLFQKIADSVKSDAFLDDDLWFDVVRELDPTDPYYQSRVGEDDFDLDLEYSTFKSQLVFRTWTNYPGQNKVIGTDGAIIIDAYSGQITNVEYTESMTDLRNWVIAIGGFADAKGPEADAVPSFFDDSASRTAFGREEEYVNASSSEDPNDVIKQATALLNEKTLDTSVTFEIAGEGQWIFGEDFDLGDRITLIWREIEYDELVTGVEVSLTEGNLAQVKIAIGAKPFYYRNVSIRLGRHLRYILRAISEISMKPSLAWSDSSPT
jgi:hypothetical protein